MFSDRYVDGVNIFNMMFHSSMTIYNLIWGSKWMLLIWIPMTTFAIGFGVYGMRKRADARARRK